MIADDEHDTARPSGFDPRYDPAFQRGYRPQPGEPTRTRARTAGAAGAAPARDRSRVEPRAELGSVEAEAAWDAAPEAVPLPDLSAPSFPVASPAGPPATGASGLPGAIAPAAGGFLAGAELSPRRNPFMLALWIIGAALVVVGVAVYAIAANASYTNNYSGTASDIGTQVFIQIGWVLAGPMITIGFATLIALLFLTALGARRRTAADGAAEAAGGDEEL